MTTASVFEVTVAGEAAISLTTIARPASASFAIMAVEKAAVKLADVVGSATVS